MWSPKKLIKNTNRVKIIAVTHMSYFLTDYR